MRRFVAYQSHIRHARHRHPQTQVAALRDKHRRLRANVNVAGALLTAEQKHFAFRRRIFNVQHQCRRRRGARQIINQQLRRRLADIVKPRRHRQ